MALKKNIDLAEYPYPPAPGQSETYADTEKAKALFLDTRFRVISLATVTNGSWVVGLQWKDLNLR